MPSAKSSFPRLNRSHPLAQGLIAAWPGYEKSGLSLNDVSGQGSTGTLNSGVSWTGSPSGGALQFDGATGLINAGTPSILANIAQKPVTWLVVFKAASTDISTNHSIIARTNSPTGTTGWLIKFGTSTQIELQIVTSAINMVRAITFSDSVSEHVMVVTHDGTLTAGNCHIYLDGAEGSYSTTTNGSGSASSDASSTFYFANNLYSFGWFAGSVSQVAIWNRVLSSTEAAALAEDSFRMYRSRPAILKAAAAPTGKLFRQGNLAGLGSGGPLFQDPLGV